MFPFGRVLVYILMLIPQVVLNPVFWTVVMLVAMQYARIGKVQQRVFGRAPESAMSLVLTSLLIGAAAGVAASLVLVFVGVTVTGVGLSFILPLALLLMLIDARFMCFSYAGGLIALSNLVFGFPEAGIPEIMTLVAVLHFVESVLILLTGDRDPLPLYMKKPDGRVVGGFLLQKFWPIPLVSMMVMASSPERIAELARGMISMPDWWPLIKPGISVPEGSELLFAMFAFPAVSAYGGFALARTPRQRSARTAYVLMGFSAALLALAVGSSLYPPLRWLAALFAPLGHELVIADGRAAETRARALYVPDPRGLKVLDVVPRSPAARAGFRSADVITAINGQPMRTSADLRDAMAGSPPWFYIEAERDAQGGRVRFSRSISGAVEMLGIIPVPGPGDEAHVSLRDTSTAGPLARWIRALVRSRHQ